jgi:hypothetical protein
LRRKILSKEFLIAELHSRQANLLSLVEQLDAIQMFEPLSDNFWSVKDILAHLTAWDKRGLKWIATAVSGDIPAIPEEGVTWTGRHKLNAQTFRESQTLSLEEVISDYRHSFRTLLKALEVIEDKDWFRLTPIQHKYGIGPAIPIAELVHWRLQHLISHSRPIKQHVVQSLGDVARSSTRSK